MKHNTGKISLGTLDFDTLTAKTTAYQALSI